MRRRKELSRNKTIKIMHSATGLSYKKCRALLKANNWDLSKACGLDLLSTRIEQFKQSFVENLLPVIDKVDEAIKNFANILAEYNNNHSEEV